MPDLDRASDPEPDPDPDLDPMPDLDPTPGLDPTPDLVVALGSNLGNRLENLLGGVRGLAGAGLAPTAFSSVYETPPVGFLDQPDFLNMVAAIPAGLPPEDVLSIFQAVEEEAGRVRMEKYGPRILDLDLLFYRDRIIRRGELTVPHPRWRERSFVVRPLLEIAPDLRDPETGWRVREVAEAWPMEPRTIRVACSDRDFRKAFEE